MILYVPIVAAVLGAVFLAQPGVGSDPVDHSEQLREPDGSWKYTNRLIDSTSPYLLQHAHNPVDWYPWGDEAIAAAREQDKPIFLSVGYSTCYWCHVMEREVFENPEIAAMMNERFINIKVDREQRPDLDEVYMTATQLVTGRGGWPMSVFLTPDLGPFFAGTYFGPEDRAGRPGFPTVADAMHDAWMNQRASVLDTADRLSDAVRANLGDQLERAGRRALTDAIPNAAQALLENSYDGRWGGFGVAPKFPQGFNYPFLLSRHEVSGEVKPLDMTLHSLRRMAAGGIYDHVGGGFHRYSTDGEWKVPHFEKMLYNQAQLVRAYLMAYRITGDRAFADVAGGVLGYVGELMTGADGQFYSALDAETNATEGAYYAWNRDQIRALLDDAQMELFDRVFAIAPIPAFPGHNHPDGGALIMRGPLVELAEDMGLAYEDLRGRVDVVLALLKEKRDGRELPHLDDKVIAGWNGLMIGAYADSAQVLGERKYLEAARDAAGFVLEEMRDERGDLLRLWRDGVSEQPAFHEDYAFFVQGLSALYSATGEERWLDAAVDLAERADRKFWDPDAGGYYFTTRSDDLIAMSKSPRDGAIPSGNSAMAHALLDLWELTGEKRWRERAGELLGAFSGVASGSPAGHVHMVHAIDRFVRSSVPEEQDASGSATGSSAVTLPSLGNTTLSPGGVGSAAHVEIGARIDRARLTVGEPFRIRVGITVSPGWHINADQVRSPNLIPTRVDVRTDLPLRVESVEYPKPTALDAAYSSTPLDVFEGEIEVSVVCVLDGPVPDDADREIRIATVYQACDDRSCLAPETDIDTIRVSVSE